MRKGSLAAACLLILGSGPGNAEAPAPGAYWVTYRLEVPHVERFAVTTAITVCRHGSDSLPRVLSANHPFANCPARNVRQTGKTLTFEISCPGRANDRAQASAAFAVTAEGLDGRIRMIMGGKNMTFVEVQSWRRIGACDRLAQRSR